VNGFLLAQEEEQHIPESAPEPRSTNSQMKSKSPCQPLAWQISRSGARGLIKTIIENNWIKNHLQLRSVHLAMALLTSLAQIIGFV